VKHFFFMLVTFWLLCALNSLFHFPILLLFFGPAPELIPHHHINRISTPSPQLKSINNKQKAITLHSSKRSCRKKSHHCHVKNTNSNNEPVLTTITEEPSWQSSASSLSNASYRDGNISDSSVSHKSKNFAPRVHLNNLQRESNLKQGEEAITIDANQPAAFKSIIVQQPCVANINIKLEFSTSTANTTTNATTSS
jgi:hypothetical protein